MYFLFLQYLNGKGLSAYIMYIHKMFLDYQKWAQGLTSKNGLILICNICFQPLANEPCLDPQGFSRVVIHCNFSLSQPQKLNFSPSPAGNNFIHYLGAWILIIHSIFSFG